MRLFCRLTLILDDELGHVQRRIRRHLHISQVSPLEAHPPQFARPIPWRVVSQNPSKEEELELARLTVFRTESFGRLGVQEADFGDGNRRRSRGEVGEDAFLGSKEFRRRLG